MVDAMILQTSNTKLRERERALQDNVSYDELMKLGISKEQSVKEAAFLEQASGLSITATDRDAEEVRRLKDDNRRLRSQPPRKNCSRCGYNHCKQGKKCSANGQICSACNKPNHFARVCRTQKRKTHSVNYRAQKNRI